MDPLGECQAQRAPAHPIAQYFRLLPEGCYYNPLDTVLLQELYDAAAAGAVDPTAQYLSNTPIRLHLEQIVDGPEALFTAAAAGPDLRTGKSIYFLTTVMPLLASPDGWKWRAGGRRHEVIEGDAAGVRSDYHLIGGAFKCSMFVYSSPEVEGLMIVKFVRRD